jgi:acylphosphatase
MKKRAHLTISGRVQGVCFRMYACEEAGQWGITGWVRNLRDGGVEVLAEGEEQDLARFVEWCRRGPSYARVTGVQEEYSEPRGDFDEFGIIQ